MGALARLRRRVSTLVFAPTLLATVPVAYQTHPPPGGHGALDTPAVWVARNPHRSLLCVTDKTDNYIEIHDPVRNVYLGRLGNPNLPSAKLGRPNAVAIAYGVPTTVGPRDVMFVVERINHRVSMFVLPYGLYLGEIGTDDLQEPMGIAIHREGTQPQVWITDIGPRPQRVFVYDLVPVASGLTGVLRLAFDAPGSATLESIVVDRVARRALVCDEGSHRDIMVFDLDGNLLTRFGAGHFINDPEGLVIFDLGNGAGYIIVTDQQSMPMEFEVFDRQDFRWLCSFSGPTTGTDGIALVQQSLPNFPCGSFYAVDADHAVDAYDWRDIAAATGLSLGRPRSPTDAGEPDAPQSVQLGSFPNPFRPAGSLRYRTEAPAPVEIAVYDLRGTRVAELVRCMQPAGVHAVDWDGRGRDGAPLASGVYFVRMRIGEQVQAHKITLVR